MKRQRISNEKLDSIGTMLLEAGRLTPDDIDQIAARPGLFAGIRRGMEVEKVSSAITPTSSSWRCSVALVPAMASVVLGLAYFGLVPTQQSSFSEKEETKSPNRQDASIAATVSGDTGVRQRTIAKVAAPQLKRATERAQVARQESTGDFYALTYDNDLDADVRLIRAELPRSALIAMGLNLHLENGNDKVQTDLLVGADGVPRAIRIVK